MKRLLILFSLFVSLQVSFGQTLVTKWLDGGSIQDSTIGSNTFNETVEPYIRSIHMGQTNGVFAFLTAPISITVTADVFSAISGNFSNNPINGFTAATAYPPGIKYIGLSTAFFVINWDTTLYGVNGDNPVLGIKKNNNLLASSLMGTQIKNSGYYYQLSGTCVVELETDDEIQLVLTTNAGDDLATIAIVYYTTTIRPFFY